MKNQIKILLILLIIMLPILASAYYPAPAPDRMVGETFLHWLSRAIFRW